VGLILASTLCRVSTLPFDTWLSILWKKEDLTLRPGRVTACAKAAWLTLTVLNLLLYLSREGVVILKKKNKTKKGKVIGILGAVLALVTAVGLIRKKICCAKTKEKAGADSKKEKA